jgi:Sec-independent protein secretion pathway component TatC
MSGQISRIGFIASMLSVVGSLYVYFVAEDQMLGIFVGLWAPTLILATKEIESMLEK